jgi:hypothetical protein
MGRLQPLTFPEILQTALAEHPVSSVARGAHQDQLSAGIASGRWA